MIVYILEWGLDSTYLTSESWVASRVFSSLAQACEKAISFGDNAPSIIAYDVSTHKVVQTWTDITNID